MGYLNKMQITLDQRKNLIRVISWLIIIFKNIF